MANGYFRFKQFTVHQQHCAMKVGTDGTLLGAWALATEGSCRIFDIGTGTGLIALMMAQRYPKAQVTAIDIDDGAVRQAKENVSASPFADRINVMKADVLTFKEEENANLSGPTANRGKAYCFIGLSSTNGGYISSTERRWTFFSYYSFRLS